MLDNNLLSLCLTFFAAIFAITNPLGSVPIFIGLTANLYPADRNKVALITSISVSIIVLIAMVLGSYILNFFGISLSAFRIAGGLMIASLAWPMLSGNLPSQKQNKAEKTELQESNIESGTNFQASSIAIVPMSMPIMAGPGTIATAILWDQKIHSILAYLGISITMVIYSVMIYVLFRLSPLITRILGSTGINIITRIIGLFMMALGCQFVITATTDITFDIIHQATSVMAK